MVTPEKIFNKCCISGIRFEHGSVLENTVVSSRKHAVLDDSMRNNGGSLSKQGSEMAKLNRHKCPTRQSKYLEGILLHKFCLLYVLYPFCNQSLDNKDSHLKNRFRCIKKS